MEVNQSPLLLKLDHFCRLKVAITAVVFSFPSVQKCVCLCAGVVIWEIYSEGRTPFENRTNLDVVNDITRGVRLYRPHRASQPLYAIMYRCWHEVLPKPLVHSLCSVFVSETN